MMKPTSSAVNPQEENETHVASTLHDHLPPTKTTVRAPFSFLLLPSVHSYIAAFRDSHEWMIRRYI